MNPYDATLPTNTEMGATGISEEYLFLKQDMFMLYEPGAKQERNGKKGGETPLIMGEDHILFFLGVTHSQLSF